MFSATFDRLFFKALLHLLAKDIFNLEQSMFVEQRAMHKVKMKSFSIGVFSEKDI